MHGTKNVKFKYILGDDNKNKHKCIPKVYSNINFRESVLSVKSEIFALPSAT